MQLTNKLSLPKTLVAAIRNDSYDPGKADISCTALIGPTMIQYLKRKHGGEIVEDASERIWSLFGQISHALIERAGVEDEVNEKRLFMEVDGWTISGQFDTLCLENNILVDYKTTSIWALKGEPKPEWEAQLNVLAELCRQNNIKVDRLQIIGIARDHRRTESLRYKDYPSVPIKVVDIPLWTTAEAQTYIHARVIQHQAEPECCTPEERWHKPDKWAVMKKGRKSAVRLLDSQEEAEVYIQQKNVQGGYVELREGENVRCASYCSVAPWCVCNK